MSLFLLPLVFPSPRLFGMSFIASECGRSLQHVATKTCVQCIGTTVTVKQLIKCSWNDHKIKGDRRSVWDHLRQCKVNIYDEKAQLSCGGTCETLFKKQRTKTVFEVSPITDGSWTKNHAFRLRSVLKKSNTNKRPNETKLVWSEHLHGDPNQVIVG